MMKLEDVSNTSYSPNIGFVTMYPWSEGYEEGGYKWWYKKVKKLKDRQNGEEKKGKGKIQVGKVNIKAFKGLRVNQGVNPC